MSPLRPSKPRVLLALSYIFVLHWGLVSCKCKLQHDPGGSMVLDLHDTKAVIGKYFNYSIPSPPSRIGERKFHYEVSEAGTSTIPTWLVFNSTSHTLHGVPLITDKGFYLMKVSLISLFENASSLQAQDVFAIDVDFETSQDLTKKDILEGVGARPHQMLYTVHQLSEHIACRRNEIKTLMSVVFDADINHLNGSSRVSLISRLVPFVNQPLEEFRISSKHSSVIDKLQADTVVAAGPGNIHSAGSRDGVVVSWPLPCATQALINQFPKVMARNIASGHFRDTTGYDVISWYISKVRDSDVVRARGRSKRETGMTVVPTPKPSQTASVITATSLLSLSPTVQSTQTLSTSSLVSTLLFTPSSSDQTISSSSSSTPGFVLLSTPLDFSSMQFSLYSPSESLQTLTSLVTESIQPSLSQSPFLTSLSMSLLSPTTALFSSSMQVSQLSPTSQERTTVYSSHQTPIFSTTMESSDSTIRFVSSSMPVSSNVISPSTSVFPSFQSTGLLSGSPSLFLSTEIMTTSLLLTESPSMSSDESLQPSSSVISVMLSSQSTSSASSATSTVSDLSSVFSFSFLSTLQSSEPETSFILQTSLDFRSVSPVASTEFSQTSFVILSSTLAGTSDFESISSIRYSTEMSTPLQTTGTTHASTLLSTQLSFSSQILSTFHASSETILSSSESVQTSSGITSTSYVETSSGGAVTPMFSTETSLLSQIQSSFFTTEPYTSTYQTEVHSSVLTTALSSAEVTQTQDVSTATTALPTSQIQSEIQSSNIAQSMTLLTAATTAPSITLSSSYSASPETSTASSTSTIMSVLDTSSQLVPSTLVVMPSSSGMISSTFAVSDMTSRSSIIGVSTPFSTADITVSSTLLSNNFSSTGIFIESTYLSEFMSSTMSLEMSSLPRLSSEGPYLTPSFLQTTELSLSSLLSLSTPAFHVGTSEMISEIQSYATSGTVETSATETGMTMIATTFFQTPVISSVSAVNTVVSEVSTLVSHPSLGTTFISESSFLSLLSSGASDFPVPSTRLSPSLSSGSFLISATPSVSLASPEQTITASQDSTVFSATPQMSSASDFLTPSISSPILATSLAPSVPSVSVSLAPSEQSMATSQDTPALSTTLSFSPYSSSATDFPVFSTIATRSFSSVSFASSTAPGVSSVSDSFAPSKHSFTASQEITSLRLESSYSSTTLFFSETQSEIPTLSFFGTFTSQQFSSSSNIQSSFSQSDMLLSTLVQPSIPSTYMLTSSTGSPSTQSSSIALSSETPDRSTIFSNSESTSVPSLITSSVPETESLVSTSSPQLSSSSKLLSTRAPSRFFSSTEGVFMSSSPSPTSVPSSSEVMPSTFIMLSSSTSVAQPSSTVGQTSVLPSLPRSDVSLPMSSLPVSTSDIQPTPSYSSEVDIFSTVAVTTELPTQPTETTTEPENQAPIIQHPIDEISLALGDVLQFPIPEDTFIDPEDGLTFDLQLDLLTTDNQPISASHWLQLINNQQTLAGVPLDSNLTSMRNEYLLSATDSEGLVAYEAFVVKVQERALEYNHEFVFTLENDFQSFVDDSQNIVFLCDDVASFLNDQNTDAFSVASVAEGSVIMTYSNKTVPTKYCDYEAIDDVFSSLAYLNGTPTTAFQDALLPNNIVTDIDRIFLNLCSVTTIPSVTNVTESSETGTNLLLVTVLPACLVSFLLLICFLIFCCCYKRKRGGEEFLLREEKQIYAKNRKPIYLDGELEDKEPRRASHPVILPIDVDPVKSSQPFKRKPRESSREPRPPPPQYRLPDYARVNLGMDDFVNDFEKNLYEMEPPTYTSQPVLHDAPDFRPQDDRPPPLYRLPPPYQSQDRGFFDESDI